MLAKGVELEFGSARELVVRLAHDRMMAAEMVKTNLLVQCASAILSAVAASSELQGVQETQGSISELFKKYGELLAPFRAIERDAAAERAEEILAEEKGKVYTVHGIGDEIGKSYLAKKKRGAPLGKLRKNV